MATWAEAKVIETVRVFLANLIDYAGLFPPADLPLEQAWTRYLDHRESSESWMLGRFVCPAARLRDLTEILSDNPPPGAPIHFSVLGRGAPEIQGFLAAVRADAGDMAAFSGAHPNLVRADAYEVKVPEKALNPDKPNHLQAALATAAFLLETQAPGPIAPFFESPLTDDASCLRLLQALQQDQKSPESSGRTRCGNLGFKLRMGGLHAEAIPGVETVASCVAGCAQARIPFKATAGLHHPFRSFDPGLQGHRHGFVNLFLAGALAMDEPLDFPNLLLLLREEDPVRFAPPISWRDRTFSPADIARCRSVFTSFGSCSFEEPVTDLKQAGWI